MPENEANPNPEVVKGNGSMKSQPPYLAIVIALLGVVGSLGAAYITAHGTARTTAEETAKTTTKDEFNDLTFAQQSTAFVGEIRAFAFGGQKGDKDIQYLRERGWLECAGQAISHDDYPELYELLERTGRAWGADGDRVTVPDLRGMFLRGWFHAAVPEHLKDEVDSRTRVSEPKTKIGNVVGSFQKDQNAIAGPFKGLGGDKYDSRIWETNQKSKKDSGWFLEMYDGRDLQTYPKVRKETAPKNVLVMYCIYTGKKVEYGTEDGS